LLVSVLMIIVGATDPASLFTTDQLGDATYYQISSTVNCALPPRPDGSSLNFFASVAMNKPMYGNSELCGACLQVNYLNQGSGKNTLPAQSNVIVTDSCPECVPASLDFGFPNQLDGRWKMKWRAVSCQINKNMQFMFQGSQQWYIKLQARNTNYPVKGINLYNGGSWKALQRTNDNFFISSGNIVFPLATPIKVQVVSITGEIVTNTISSIVNDVVIDGNSQFKQGVLGASPPTPVTPTPTPSGGTGGSLGSSNLITFNNANNWWIQIQVSSSIGTISKVSFNSQAGYVDSLPVSGWSAYEFTMSSPKIINTGSPVSFRIYDTNGVARYFTAQYLNNESLKETTSSSFPVTTLEASNVLDEDLEEEF